MPRTTKSKPDTSARALARKHTKEAIRELVKLMKAAKSEPVRVAAIKTLLEYGWGKPSAMPEDGPEGQLTGDLPIDEVIIRHI